MDVGEPHRSWCFGAASARFFKQAGVEVVPLKEKPMSDYTCPKCGEPVSMMGHGATSPCSGVLSEKATELGRLRVRVLALRAELERDIPTCPFCNTGRFEPTATAGRFACSICRSIALDGREMEAVKIAEGKVP
jgi:ribosomal protein L37AE/L43A